LANDGGKISVELAYDLIAEALAAVPSGLAPEWVFLERAKGRYLAEDVLCVLDHPAFDQSAMDGVAFQWSADLKPLRLVGTVAAGDAPRPETLGAGEAVRIMTGAPIPRGADCVEMIEKVTIDGETCQLHGEPARGQHIRFAGENLKSGEVLAPRGSRVSSGRIAALAAQGIREIAVTRPLRLGLATTGNEVVSIHQPLSPGQIYNSNAPALTAMLEGIDATVLDLGVLPDNLDATRATLGKQTDLDAVILTGGVSMGAFDFVPEAAVGAGFRQLFHKVAMKPGKPIWVGRHGSGTWLFGLPGNPVSAMVGAALFIDPVLEACRSGQFERPRWVPLPLAKPVRNRSSFPFFSGGRILSENGKASVLPVTTSGSGDVVRFGASETLVRIEPGAVLAQGSMAEVLLPSNLVIG